MQLVQCVYNLLKFYYGFVAVLRRHNTAQAAVTTCKARARNGSVLVVFGPNTNRRANNCAAEL